MQAEPLPLSPHFLPRPPPSAATGTPAAKHSSGKAAPRVHDDASLNSLLESPPELVCPITQSLYLDPVLTAAGHVYERAAIETHLQRSSTDPLTRQHLINKSLTPVYVIKSKAHEYREACAKACVERACSGGACPERSVRLLRRACELAADAEGLTVQGLPRDTIAYVQSHASNAYDSLALQSFAQGLFDAGYRDKAASVYHSLLSGDVDRAQQAELLRRCLACWTAPGAGAGPSASSSGSGGSSASASGSADGGYGAGALVTSGSSGSGVASAPHADSHVYEKLVQLFEGGGAQGQGGAACFSWPQVIDVATEAGFGDEFAIRLCEQLLFAPPPCGLAAGGAVAAPAGGWPREKEILMKYVSVLTQGLKRRQTETERRLAELDRWRRQLSGGGSRSSSGASSPMRGGPRRRGDAFGRGGGGPLPRWLSHPLLLGGCTLLGVAVPDDHVALRLLRAVPMALLLASQQH